MGYISYLSLYRLEDTKENKIKYLVEYKGWTIELATEYIERVNK